MGNSWLSQDTIADPGTHVGVSSDSEYSQGPVCRHSPRLYCHWTGCRRLFQRQNHLTDDRTIPVNP
jgi:hypothetical protein